MSTADLVQRECVRYGAILLGSSALIYSCRRLRRMHAVTERWLRDRNLAYASGTGAILLCGGLYTREAYMHEQAAKALTDIRHEVNSNDSNYFKEAVWPSLVAKKLTGWHPPVGSILAAPGGEYRLDKIVSCWGGYASLFESKSGDLPPLVVYRGTTNFDLYTVVENFRREIGWPSWDTLQPTITTWLQGREHNVIGYSLGGVHAQYHALHIEQVGRLTTVASPRITKERMTGDLQPEKAFHIIDVDDVIPKMGGSRLVSARKLKDTVVWLLDKHGKTEDESWQAASQTPQPRSLSQSVSDLHRSVGPHRESKFSQPHTPHRRSGEKLGDFLTRKITTYEEWRRWLAGQGRL